MNVALGVILGFIAQTLIIWLALSLLIYLANPAFINPKTENIDLWTVFWVSLVLAVFTAIITGLISWFGGMSLVGDGLMPMGSSFSCGKVQSAAPSKCDSSKLMQSTSQSSTVQGCM